MIDKLVTIIIENLKKSKYKFMSIDEVSEILKKALKDKYDSSIAISVKQSLINDSRTEFFKQGYYYHDHKSYYCTGNWLVINGVYDNPVEAKFKKGWYSTQDTDDYELED